MASTKTNAATTLVMFGTILIAALLSGAAASPCEDEISRLTPCYSYIEGSGLSRPASDCCSNLGGMATTKPQCLCKILNADNNLNKTRIAALPKACNITTPPPSACNSSKNDFVDSCIMMSFYCTHLINK